MNYYFCCVVGGVVLSGEGIFRYVDVGVLKLECG